jgi:hypothetical protein
MFLVTNLPGEPSNGTQTENEAMAASEKVLRLPDLDFAKRGVLNTLGSPQSVRAYAAAIDDFVEWYCSEPRLAFSRLVVLRYRLELEARQLAASTINLRLAAIRVTRDSQFDNFSRRLLLCEKRHRAQPVRGKGLSHLSSDVFWEQPLFCPNSGRGRLRRR